MRPPLLSRPPYDIKSRDRTSGRWLLSSLRPSLPPSLQEKNAYNSPLNFTHQTDVRFVRAVRAPRWTRTGRRECEQRAVCHSCWLFLQRQPSTGKLDSYCEDSCKRCAGHSPNVLIRYVSLSLFQLKSVCCYCGQPRKGSMTLLLTILMAY